MNTRNQNHNQLIILYFDEFEKMLNVRMSMSTGVVLFENDCSMDLRQYSQLFLVVRLMFLQRQSKDDTYILMVLSLIPEK